MWTLVDTIDHMHFDMDLKLCSVLVSLRAERTFVNSICGIRIMCFDMHQQSFWCLQLLQANVTLSSQYYGTVRFHMFLCAKKQQIFEKIMEKSIICQFSTN